jgi:hypothetical protein
MARRSGSTVLGAHRLRLADEAARLFADGSCATLLEARRKIGLRHGIRQPAELPSESELEQALREHQRLFQSDSQPQALARLRTAAVEAMSALQTFRPRLVGDVLTGSAHAHSAVSLHLFADEPEAVIRCLIEFGIPYRSGSCRLHFGGEGKATVLPLLQFADADAEYRLSVIPLALEHSIPLAADGHGVMRRATLAEVRRLVEAGDAGSAT